MNNGPAAYSVALSVGLRPIYESIRGLLATATRDDVRARHQVGVIISGVKNATDKYGARAVEQLARALGSNVHTLYRCAAVSECWSPSQLEALLLRTTPGGQPLSWSHLVIISSIPSKRRRNELLDRALEDSLSVRELLAVLKGPSERSGSRTSALAVLHRIARTTERWSSMATEMHAELLAELEGSQSGISDPSALIDRVIAAQERLKGVVQAQLAQLHSEKGRFLRKTRPGVVRPVGLLLAGMPSR